MTLSNNSSLSKVLKPLQWLAAGSAFVSCLVFLYMMIVFDQVNSIEFLEPSEDVEGLRILGTAWVVTVGVTMLLLTLGLLSFMAWIYRAYRNLQYLEVDLQYWLGWAILGFLIPFANYILPILMLQELLKKSHGLLRVFEEDSGLKRMETIRNATVVWWAIYVISLLTINIMSNRLREDDALLGMYLVVALSIGAIVLAVLGNFIMRHHIECETRIFALSKTGRIEDFKVKKAAYENGTLEEEKPDWYKDEEGASFQPEIDVFRDQKAGSGE